jgi:cell division inhibitor SulA/protein ImuA
MPSSLAELLRHPNLWRGEACAHATSALPSGFAALDAHLPGGGWPRGALTELITRTTGIGELALLMPICATLTQAGYQVAFVAPAYIPYAPALAAAGLHLHRLLLIKTASHKDLLWAIEQCLKSKHCGAVLAWPNSIEASALRRLQLACEQSNNSAFLFMQETTLLNASTAALRLLLTPAMEDKLAVRILKRRGGALPHPLILDPRHALAA